MNIYIKDLRKAFGEKVAVDIDTYEVKHGEMMGLVGNNGAGKTTLFRLMLDLLKADSGNVEFAVVGYYNSGEHEGETGLSVYSFKSSSYPQL